MNQAFAMRYHLKIHQFILLKNCCCDQKDDLRNNEGSDAEDEW